MKTWRQNEGKLYGGGTDATFFTPHPSSPPYSPNIKVWRKRDKRTFDEIFTQRHPAKTGMLLEKTRRHLDFLSRHPVTANDVSYQAIKIQEKTCIYREKPDSWSTMETNQSFYGLEVKAKSKNKWTTFLRTAHIGSDVRLEFHRTSAREPDTPNDSVMKWRKNRRWPTVLGGFFTLLISLKISPTSFLAKVVASADG